MNTSRIELWIGGVKQDVTPIYSDKVAIDKERGDNEMYYRTKLNGTIKFVGADFDLIEGQSLDTEMTLKVYGIDTTFTKSPSGETSTSRINVSERIDITHPETLIATAKFTKMDCTLNYDDKICEVKATSTDRYDKLIAGLDNEHDLISLAPERESITMWKRGVLQIYRLRDTKITNIIGNMSYEVDVNSAVDIEELTPTKLVEEYHFAKLEENRYIVSFIVGEGDARYDVFRDAAGIYEGTESEGNLVLTNKDNPLWELVRNVDYQGKAVLVLRYDNNYVTFPYASGVYAYVGSDANAALDDDSVTSIDGYALSQSTQYSLAPLGILPGVGFNKNLINTFVRLLTDKNVWGSFPIPLEDISAKNLNYTRCRPFDVGSDKIIRSFEVQDEPTKWGVNGDGKYFVKPQPSDSTFNMIPIGWNTWIPDSVWYESNPLVSAVIDSPIYGYSVQWTLNDAYPLWSAIKVLLAKIDESITFEPTTDYSEFLFGDVSASIAKHTVQKLFITPITNVKRTYYNQAARKGKITLKQILDMLRNTYQLYWFIDEDNRLRIEHILWFRNGGSYDGVAEPEIDLTSIKSPMSMRRWSEGLNSVSYDSKSLVKRYEFEWGNKASDVFDGFAIDIANRYARDGKTLNVSVPNFMSDVDLIMSAPDAVNDDMFALIGTGSDNECPLKYIEPIQNIKAPTYGMQNPYLSFYYLEQVYWTYDMGGDDVSIDDYEKDDSTEPVFDVKGIQRVRRQSVKFPVGTSGVGVEGLVKTDIGEGQWTKASYNIEDGMVSMDLALDIDDSQNNPPND